MHSGLHKPFWLCQWFLQPLLWRSHGAQWSWLPGKKKGKVKNLTVAMYDEYYVVSFHMQSRSRSDILWDAIFRNCSEIQIPDLFLRSIFPNCSWENWHFFSSLNPFPNHKIYSFKMKDFVYNSFEIDENSRKFSKQVENTVGKRRNCSLRAISPFPTVFWKVLYCRHIKTRDCLGKG